MILTLEYCKKVLIDATGSYECRSREHICTAFGIAVDTIKKDEEKGLITRSNPKGGHPRYSVTEIHPYLIKKGLYDSPAMMGGKSSQANLAIAA